MKHALIGTGICATLVLVLAAATHVPQGVQGKGKAVQEKAAQDKQDPDARKRLETKVRKLLEVTGGAKMGQQVMGQMLDVFRRNPNLPEGFIDEFKKAAKPEKLIDMVVPIYMKHSTEKDVDAVTAFFSSQAGKRWIAAQPKIVQESMAAGQKWGQELAMEVMGKLREGK